MSFSRNSAQRLDVSPTLAAVTSTRNSIASGLEFVTCTFTSFPPGWFRLFRQFNGLRPDTLDRCAVIQVKHHAADIGTGLTRPIVERLLNKVIERHDKPPQIP